jgi:hypothetical protein
MRNLHKNVCFKTIWRLLKQLNKIKIWQLIIRIIFLLISSKLEYLENLTENKLICSMYNCSKHLDFHRHISWSFSSLFLFPQRIRCACLFCWYWWNYWPLLFKLSFHEKRILCRFLNLLIFLCKKGGSHKWV